MQEQQEQQHQSLKDEPDVFEVPQYGCDEPQIADVGAIQERDTSGGERSNVDISIQDVDNDKDFQ